ncbi:hypothetical protein BC834DRAFT_901343 [Gloeopeniophorella convolvens]|nr:hypothetical protein BC834DRAFT_901343 [Gloeopeniophorella convolvens]
MYGRSRRVLWFLIVLSAVNLGIVGWTISRGEGTDIIQVISTFPGCNQWVGVDAGTRLSITWACVSVFDSAIFSLTAYKALIAGRRVRLLNVLVRDGAMYFTIIFLVNVANVFILRFAPPLQRNSTLTLTSVLATIMVARVMLNLREEHASTDPPTERTRTGMAFYEPPALINSDGTTDTSRSSNPEDIELGHFT